MTTQVHEHPETLTPYSNLDQLPLAGQWRLGRSSSVNRDKNPYTGETILEIPQASREDMDEAYRAAARSQPEWASETPAARAAVLRRAADIMQARRDEVISWLIRESGSTRIKAVLEFESTHAVIMEAAALTHFMEGAILPTDIPGKESRIYRKPAGVVGVISPWNWPLHLTARSLFPALAVGNAVVVKPASDTPVTGGLLLAHILDEAGLPPSVLSVVVGRGSEIGDAFVAHPTPRVISFTGSTAVGRGIARLAADSPILKKVELELGGNSPMVILDDADLGDALDAAMFGKFLHQGQICMIANRFIVDQRVYEPFVEQFVERVRNLKVGDPDAPDTMIGPIINESQLEGLKKRIDEARSMGIREAVGGEPEGLVLPPHVYVDVSNDQPIAQNELFGPIAPIIRANDEEDALRLANDTEYGLSSSVFTSDLERGVRFARRIEAGMAHVNDQPVNDIPFSPFGGEKNSGIGRFNGRWAVEAFSTVQMVTVQHVPRLYPQNAEAIQGPWGGG